MKIGIVGNGGIVTYALESLKNTDIEVKALWCRNRDKGVPLQEKYGFDSLYTDYEEFLESGEFDTAYIGLINSLHYEYAKKALLAGKNVICEKPFTVTYSEAEELVRISEEKNVMLFEAIMSRYSENYEELRRQLFRVGDVKAVRVNYSQYSSRYNAYLEGKVLPAFDPKLAGGALMDINIYCIHFTEGLFGRPQTVCYYPNKGFNGVDTSGILIADYGSFKAVCTGAKDSASRSGAVIQGTKGYITMDSRPGVIKALTYTALDGTSEELDIAEEANPMQKEFLVIRDIIDSRNTAKARQWMKDSLTVMKIVDQASGR